MRPVHRIAELLPRMTKEQFESLVKSVRESGIQVPIVLHDGKIIDGRHRALAAEQTGQPLRCISLIIDAKDPAEIELEVARQIKLRNCDRRHMTQSQLAMFAAALSSDATLRQAKARLAANGHQRVPARSTEQATDIATEAPEPAISAAQAAKLAGVSKSAVSAAAKVLEHGDEGLVEQVKQGGVSVFEAAKRVELAEAEEAPPPPPEPEPEPVPEQVRDALGSTIDERLEPIFLQVPKFYELRRKAWHIKRELEKLAEDPAGYWVPIQECRNLISKLSKAIKFAAPHTECAKCRREFDKECRVCMGTGWVNEENHNRTRTEDDDEWLKQREQ